MLKLHGSINWIWTERQARGSLPYQTVRLADGTDQGDPALLFGHGAKLQAQGPFLGLFAAFERELEKSPQLVCIGYSFRDDHVNELIRRWTAAPHARRLTVVDPKWPGALDDASPFQSELIRAFDQQSGPARPPDAVSLDVVRQQTKHALAQLVA